MERPTFKPEGYILNFIHPTSDCSKKGQTIRVNTFELDPAKLNEHMEQVCGECGMQLEFLSESGKHGTWIQPEPGL